MAYHSIKMAGVDETRNVPADIENWREESIQAQLEGCNIDSIVRGLETSHVSASLAVGTPRYIVNTY